MTTQPKDILLNQYRKNRMKQFQIIIISLLMLIVLSCDKKGKDEISDIYGKWTATDYISLESVSYPKNNGFSPIIEIKTDGTYNLKLDMNGCFGNFSLSDSSSSISFSAAVCTEICCDSEFSLKIANMLHQVKTYQIEKNKLKLEVPGWGWINLELND